MGEFTSLKDVVVKRFSLQKKCAMSIKPIVTYKVKLLSKDWLRT
jgi:hypothetical protein